MDVQGPGMRAAWEAAIAVLYEALGVRSRVPGNVRDAFVAVSAGIPMASCEMTMGGGFLTIP